MVRFVEDGAKLKTPSEILPPLRDEKDGFDVIISFAFKGQKKAIRGSKETDRKCCVRD